MRRKEKLFQELAEINDVMSRGEVIRVAMVDGDAPYMVPMSYGHKDGVIYLHCAHEGRKVDILKQNQKVWFEVTVDGGLIKKEQSCGWSYSFKCVMGMGKAVFVEDKAEKLEALNAIMEHYGRVDNSFPDKAVDATEVIRIDIEEMTGKKSPA
ncbi:MAG: pyridoxamine 5'-phosphate oxidase family protein [Denitrovibrio sp.]|nr:MAG: pyridoxamine 5'-phosphate oxidase family protein [Denitrovibrio sp.]